MSPRTLLRLLPSFGFAVALCSLAAQSAPFSSLIDATVLHDIEAEGQASAVESDGLPRLLPQHPDSDAIRSALATEKPKVLVEALFVYARTGPTTESGRQAELAAIFGLMRRIGTLRGIQYYSHSQKAMETLYVDSSRVSGPDGSVRLEDELPPAPGSVPATDSLYALLQDQRFGKNVYRYDFTTLSRGILVTSTNETRMSYGILPIFAPEQLTMRLLVLPTSDGILFYVETGANAPGFLRSRIGESFKNRAAALYGWFRDNFHGPALP